MANLEKDKKIKKEILKFKRIFKNLDDNSKKITENLINKAAFMSVSLDELQDIINQKGYTEEYQNGANQSGIKKCSELEIYNTMVKNFTSVINQMYSMLPSSKTSEVQKAGEELAKFLTKGKPTGRGKI